MKSLRLILAAFAAVCMISVAAHAQAADPTGTWTWSQPSRGGGTATVTAKLAFANGALTGSVTLPPRGGGDPISIDISDATFTDGTVAFSTVQTFNDNKRVTKYTGKLDGDTITGTVLRPGRGGAEPTPADWVAKRGAMAAAPAAM
jgi:hypothetical protein